MNRRFALSLVLAAALATLTAPTAGLAQARSDPAGPDSLGADWGAQQDQAREGVKQGRFVPLFRVIAEIRRRTPGRQLDAGIEEAGGRSVYRVRWAASDGRRLDYLVDAESGAILGVN